MYGCKGIGLSISQTNAIMLDSPNLKLNNLKLAFHQYILPPFPPADRGGLLPLAGKNDPTPGPSPWRGGEFGHQE